MFLYVKYSPEDNRIWSDLSDQNYYVFKSGSSEIRLRKRSSIPDTYAQVTDGELNFGYKSPSGYEYLICEAKNDSLYVQRDHLATLPLFYCELNGSVVLSNQISELPASGLNVTQAANYFYLIRDSDQTLDQNTKVLFSAHKLTYSQQKVEIEQTSARSNFDISDPLQFKSVFDQTLSDLFDEYQSEHVYVEASGGLDSSSVAISAANSGRSVNLVSAGFENTFANAQREKLKALSDLTNSKLQLYDYDPERHAPLSRFLRSEPRRFYEYNEIYTESLTELADWCKSQSANQIYTGIGGNELFEENSDVIELGLGPEYIEFLNKCKFSEYSEQLTTARGRLLEEIVYLDARPTPQVRSVDMANLSTNNIFIENNVWPIAPLSNVELLRFTRGLELKFRANKNILRAWYQALSAPEVLYTKSSNEYFSTILESTIDNTYLKLNNKYNLLKSEYVEMLGLSNINVASLSSTQKLALSVIALNS